MRWRAGFRAVSRTLLPLPHSSRHPLGDGPPEFRQPRGDLTHRVEAAEPAARLPAGFRRTRFAGNIVRRGVDIGGQVLAERPYADRRAMELEARGQMFQD